MTKYQYILFFLLSALGIAVLSGCGSSSDVASRRRYFWPEPPDSPRVEYVQTFRGQDDFGGSVGSFLNSITGGEGSANFSRPFDIAIGENGKFYITDANYGMLLYDTKEKKFEQFGANSAIELKDPRGVAYARGKIYVGLAGSKKIAVLDEEGNSIRAIGRDGTFENPVDIVADTLRNRILIVDIKSHQVHVYSENGDSLFSIGKRGEGDGDFNYPQSVAVDSDGNMYVVDGFNFRVEIFDSTGKYLRKFGQQGEYFGEFSRPKGIALDSYRNIYVLDGVHQNFQIFNNEGQLLLFVGKFSPLNDGFQNPVSIAIDRNNMIYVTDNLNQRVQVFRLLKGD